MINSNPIKKNFVVKQKQLLVHLWKESYYLKKIKRKKRKHPKFKFNKEELCCKAEASACAPEEPRLISEEGKRKESKPSKFKHNKEELCCKAEASACTP